MQASRHSEKCEGVGGFLAFIIAWSPPAFHVRHACMHAYGLLLLNLHAEQQRGGIHTCTLCTLLTDTYPPTQQSKKRGGLLESRARCIDWFGLTLTNLTARVT